MAATAEEEAEWMMTAEWEKEEGKQGMRRKKRYGLVEYWALPTCSAKCLNHRRWR
jgi:adiponectin receptor